MAEMTVAEAVEMSKHEVSLFMKRRCEIAALLESQQQTIEAMKCCGNCKNYDYKWNDCPMRWEDKMTKCDKWEGVSRDD